MHMLFLLSTLTFTAPLTVKAPTHAPAPQNAFWTHCGPSMPLSTDYRQTVRVCR